MIPLTTRLIAGIVVLAGAFAAAIWAPLDPTQSAYVWGLVTATGVAVVSMIGGKVGQRLSTPPPASGSQGEREASVRIIVEPREPSGVHVTQTPTKPPPSGVAPVPTPTPSVPLGTFRDDEEDTKP